MDAAGNSGLVVSQELPIYIHVNNFLQNAVRLPEHMVIARTRIPQTITHAICNESWRGSRLRTSEEHNLVRLIREDDTTSGFPIPDDVGAVYQNPPEIQESQMTR